MNYTFSKTSLWKKFIRNFVYFNSKLFNEAKFRFVQLSRVHEYCFYVNCRFSSLNCIPLNSAAKIQNRLQSPFFSFLYQATFILQLDRRQKYESRLWKTSFLPTSPSRHTSRTNFSLEKIQIAYSTFHAAAR